MKFNKWTLGLAAVGAVSLASAACADEQMSQVQTALSQTTISGYVDTAAIWRPGTDQSGGVGPKMPDYSFAKNDGFYLNAVDIAIDRPENETPWAAGYHVELMAGPDSVPNVDSSTANFGIRQAYLALRTPVGTSGIDWKVGVWDTIIGYESTSDPLDPNYTRSYGYSIEPTTHTGILGTYKVNDTISVSGGVANSSSVDDGTPAAINGTATYESQKAYMGAVALTAPSSWGWLNGATFNGGVINSIDSVHNEGTITSWYAGATIPTPMTALKTGIAYDYRAETEGESWVLGLYASYQFNDKTSFNLRGEYLEDSLDELYGASVVHRNAAEELTATLQYNLWANVLSRVEFRWDHVLHGKPFGINSAGASFRANDFMLALNLIYQF
ncbi:MAG: outer membrane beta-barrel protein [Verrucomicrobia bacterium]|nr:outer membrane beta-barrel protein [Verrucomicrobiota bacterium]MDE3098117.1 outer membrane beta-barrel protein [Verrucomicrobiota bacterium]